MFVARENRFDTQGTIGRDAIDGEPDGLVADERNRCLGSAICRIERGRALAGRMIT